MAESSPEDAQLVQANKSPTKKQKIDTLTFQDPTSTMMFTVGEGEPKSFLVHKEVACKSPVIAKFVEGSGDLPYHFQNSTEREVRLLLQYLYSQKLVLEQLRDDPELTDDLIREEDLALVKLWVLAEELEIPSLQNLVINSIDEIYRKYAAFPTDYLRIVYKITSSDSKLRGYFVTLFAEVVAPADILDEDYEFPQIFLRELAYFACKKLENREKKFRISQFHCKEE
ncbi:hypothetical protein BDZ45DRAFT_679097 [Acephala macrosclerotiorum]|nr:hypothetical protein BDZ45DRAFT_679097 [Acephala macrosclerotiorum]